MSKIEIINTYINTLNRERNLRIYLPKDYQKNHLLYPVLYMHDGQNLFSDKDAAYNVSWGLKETIDSFYKVKQKQIIVVGIDNGNEHRFNEYSPWVSSNLRKFIPELELDIAGGEGDKYLEWIVSSLIPFINQNYRTNNINYLAGSSMGANISLYAGIKYPHVFQKLGCISPAFWFSMKEFKNLIKENNLEHLNIYLDIGTKESRLPSNPELRYTKKIYKLLKQKKAKIKFIIEKDALHREADWKRRFPLFLEYLLK